MGNKLITKILSIILIMAVVLVGGVNTQITRADDITPTDADLALDAKLLSDAKTASKANLDKYKDITDYRAEEQTQLTAAINAGKTAIDNGTTIEIVQTEETNAKATIDAIKTDAQLTADANKPTPTGDVSALPLVAAVTIGMAGMVVIQKKKQSI